MSNTIANVAQDIMSLTMLSESNITVLIEQHLNLMLLERSKDRLSEYEVERFKNVVKIYMQNYKVLNPRDDFSMVDDDVKQ